MCLTRPNFRFRVWWWRRWKTTNWLSEMSILAHGSRMHSASLMFCAFALILPWRDIKVPQQILTMASQEQLSCTWPGFSRSFKNSLHKAQKRVFDVCVTKACLRYHACYGVFLWSCWNWASPCESRGKSNQNSARIQHRLARFLRRESREWAFVPAQ